MLIEKTSSSSSSVCNGARGARKQSTESARCESAVGRGWTYKGLGLRAEHEHHQPQDGVPASEPMIVRPSARMAIRAQRERSAPVEGAGGGPAADLKWEHECLSRMTVSVRVARRYRNISVEHTFKKLKNPVIQGSVRSEVRKRSDRISTHRSLQLRETCRARGPANSHRERIKRKTLAGRHTWSGYTSALYENGTGPAPYRRARFRH